MRQFHRQAGICLALLLLTVLGKAQTILKGIITDELNQPIPGVSIRLGEQVTLSDSSGRYTFTGIKPGQHQVVFSHVGYETFQEKFMLRSNTQEKLLHVHLLNTSTALQAVEVTGRKEKGYTNTESYAGSKTAMPIKDVPQSIQYVTKEVMQDQGAVRMSDIVKNMSGVNQHTFYDDVTIRGFRNQGGVGTNSSTQLFNGLRTFNGFWRQNLLNYLERVEVIKGPAAALYGNANPGGTINKVTKKPLQEDRKSVNLQLGSWNTMRINTDFTGPLNKDKTVLYRLNLGYENANSFRDLMFDKNIVIAPSISYLPSEKTRINLDVVYNKSDSRLDRGQSVFGSSDLYSTPISMNVADINDYLKEETYLVTASLSHRVAEHITFNTSFLRTGYRQDLFEHRSTAFAVDKQGKQIQELAFRRASMRHNEQYANSLSSYLNFDFKTGMPEHKVVVGYDFNDSRIPVGSSQSDATGYRLKDGTIATKYAVKDSAKYEFYQYKGRMIPKPNVPSFDLSANQHSLLDVNGYVYQPNNTDVVVPYYAQQHSIYVQDQITVNRLKLLAGLRYNYYIDHLGYATGNVNKVKQHSVLPRIGATYEVNAHINAYATYAAGYNPQSAASQNPLNGGPFDPLKSILLEAGLKTSWFNNRLSATMSVYSIEQRNSLYNALDPDNPDKLIQIGKEKSKGVELDIVGSILPNLYIIATYAHNDAVVEGAKGMTDTLYNHQQKPNAPKDQGSIWAKYECLNGPLKGFGIGAGANYVGKRTFGFLGTNGIIPSSGPEYLLVNSALYYRMNKLLIQLNFNNITNKTHWVGGYDSSRLYPGAPRNWLTSVSYIF
ncbi:TonB-dependent siderophore receptor [Chitinophaga sp. 212800010-3]|uniref:TonB-dependent siderophore receptor n=1 Tax=unclassified Chitinophaga TaxID=2619133 RepID=UPI002DF67E8E|nr:TonB-dependent siderophore receptor [Chitinophaga sp. 212800010-3]